ncbi:hypothetical protein GCM10010124_08960 [Pilimelia terevasa]|uniref:Peptide chain release factor 1 n=1 Tax=Pilimelia terevasa TaxID=53372 RepID=A0A8J3BJD7_9ACTN|nr:Vms1/Ankzf1 family peptidyl-tRNA hydrolase [Pilimelia terevasa]GGK18558.1 hypothetical protein GCM10010124_08960 [Pilimelia terevasa]
MQLSFLRPLYARPGPWASVYLDLTSAPSSLGADRDLRWREAAAALLEAGADPGAITAVADAVAAHRASPERRGLALFAVDGEIAWSETMATPPPATVATWAPLPDVLPLLRQRGEEVAWVRIVADRTGAALDAGSVGGVTRHTEVTGGEQFPIRKVKPGGWSSPRYQRAAEVTWHRNAGDVAAAAADLAQAVGAEVMVVGGDVRAVQQLVEQLPARWQARVVRTEAGSRAPGADRAALDDVTAQAIAEVAARHTRAACDAFGHQHGAAGTADTGLAAAIAALRRGQVDTLLLAGDSANGTPLWIGPAPTQLAATRAEIAQLGGEAPQQARADAAIMRALACTDAELVLIGPDDVTPDGDIGVLLRYADLASTR